MLSELVEQYGIWPTVDKRESIQKCLSAEISKAATADGEVLQLLCVFLFVIGNVEDSLLIWHAKNLNWDTFHSIGVELLCGAGLTSTRQYFLENSNEENAAKALAYLDECIEAGDFNDFSKSQLVTEFNDYYADIQHAED